MTTADDTRTRILAAARELFAERGYAAHLAGRHRRRRGPDQDGRRLPLPPEGPAGRRAAGARRRRHRWRCSDTDFAGDRRAFVEALVDLHGTAPRGDPPAHGGHRRRRRRAAGLAGRGHPGRSATRSRQARRPRPRRRRPGSAAGPCSAPCSGAPCRRWTCPKSGYASHCWSARPWPSRTFDLAGPCLAGLAPHPGIGRHTVVGHISEVRMVTLAVVGAGSRGTGYARHAVESGRARVVAVAEPDASRPGQVRRRARPRRYAGLAGARGAGRLADAVIIATQDRLHAEPAVRVRRAGLPHPAGEADGADRATTAAGSPTRPSAPASIFAVCHVLRYTPYTRALKELLDAGRIGDIVSIQHLEPVGWWHQAHSFVRGNWRRDGRARRRCCWPSPATTSTGWSHLIGRRRAGVARSAA